MGTVNKFGTTRLLDSSNAQFYGQERVNAEIFTAMELLGRKLERSEAERDRLTRRLAQLESSATLDEKTGKLYLPAVIDPVQQRAGAPAPRWMLASTVFSTFLAFVALGIALFSNTGPQLTKDQIAMLDALKGPQLAMVSPENKGWKQAETETPAVAPAAETTATPAAETAQAQPPAADAAAMTETPAVAAAEEPVAAPPQPVADNTPPAAEEPVVAQEQELKPDTTLPKSLAALEQRAFQGIPEAQHDLATLYADGSRVTKDYTRALYWFQKAANRGIANADYNLGVMYQQGLGVKPDMKIAISWYDKAAEIGHPEAMYNLGIAYIQGIGTATDIDKGVAYFKRAANAGVSQAAYNLGVLYESNFIGAIDTAKAKEWYQVAAREGHAEAKTAVERLTASASAHELNAVEPASGE